MKYCEECGKKIKDEARYCPHCGHEINDIEIVYDERTRRFKESYINSQPRYQPRSRLLSSIFAFFFGEIGLQHFYNGHIAAGVVCICFFWTGIPFIVGLINGVQYLSCNDDYEFERRYCIAI